MEYLKTIWNEKSVSGENLGQQIIFSKIDLSDNWEDKRVIYYPDGTIKAADSKGGYLGEEIADGPIPKTLEEMNNPPELITTEITKEEFEAEWQKAISQPGFELKPYGWLEKK